jgi:two-component system chemotaxis response regulator CheB
MQYVKDRGGVTVVQDPVTAELPYMPQQAITRMLPDYIVPTEEIPGFVRDWAYR